MLFKLSTAFVLIAALAQVKAAPTLISRHEGHDDSTTTSAGTSADSIVKQNALDSQKLNARYATLKATDTCTGAEMACIDGAFAMCVDGKWSLQNCAANTKCYALPLLLKAGTGLVCDTEEDANQRFKDAGVTGGAKGTDVAGDDEDEEEDCEEVLEDDEDDLPECDDEEAFPESTPTASQPAATASKAARDIPHKFIYRRQASTIAELPPASTSATVSSSATSTVSPTATISSAATSTGTNPVVTPTVVIGRDGIVTVTIMSTATVTATPSDCAATSSSATIPVATVTSASSATPVTVKSATSTASSASSSLSFSSATPSVTSSSTVIATEASSTAPVIVLTTSPSSATLAPSATLDNRPTSGGLSFTFGAPVPTA